MQAVVLLQPFFKTTKSDPWTFKQKLNICPTPGFSSCPNDSIRMVSRCTFVHFILCLQQTTLNLSSSTAATPRILITVTTIYQVFGCLFPAVPSSFSSIFIYLFICFLIWCFFSKQVRQKVHASFNISHFLQHTVCSLFWNWMLSGKILLNSRDLGFPGHHRVSVYAFIRVIVGILFLTRLTIFFPPSSSKYPPHCWVIPTHVLFQITLTHNFCQTKSVY